MTLDRSLIAVPLFIDVTDVIRSMKCSRSGACEHMRAALGRQPGERGQSRVPLYVWERYVRKRFDPEARARRQNAWPKPAKARWRALPFE